MRIVVAGSSGFIGSALVRRLRANGHQVLRLVRRVPAERDERRWDPPAGTVDADALAGADAVINLCGAGVATRRWSHARKQVLLDSRVEPTEVLAESVARQRIPLLINASAIGFYGDTGTSTVGESAPTGPGFLARLVTEWEAATSPAADAGARVVLLRSGHVLGADGGLLRAIRPLFSLGLGAKLGTGDQYMSWISRTDELAAIEFLVRRDDIAGPVNLVAPNPVTNVEFTAELARALRRPALWTAPAPALRALLGELADEGVLVGQRVTPRVLADAGFAFAHPTLAQALAAELPR
ncbi:MAG: TIGR01777 family oxidoreductase [Sciscionella sp.]|nr:TIGR01777 family oxidoreductase [Sciscionella sp.]